MVSLSDKKKTPGKKEKSLMLFKSKIPAIIFQLKFKKNRMKVWAVEMDKCTSWRTIPKYILPPYPGMKTQDTRMFMGLFMADLHD